MAYGAVGRVLTSWVNSISSLQKFEYGSLVRQLVVDTGRKTKESQRNNADKEHMRKQQSWVQRGL